MDFCWRLIVLGNTLGCEGRIDFAGSIVFLQDIYEIGLCRSICTSTSIIRDRINLRKGSSSLLGIVQILRYLNYSCLVSLLFIGSLRVVTGKTLTSLEEEGKGLFSSSRIDLL